MSRAGLELVPLDCPTCGAAIEALGADVVYYCTACRNGYTFGDRENILEPVEVGFVADSSIAAEVYLPFWLLPAEVSIVDRKAKGGGLSGLMSFFSGDRGGSPNLGPGKGTFAVPAFECSLESLTTLTQHYSERSGDWKERLGEKLLRGRYGIDDAKKLAHYALIASEVGKSDTLTRLDYRIDFGEARLLGVPFVRRGGELVDGLFGVGI